MQPRRYTTASTRGMARGAVAGPIRRASVATPFFLSHQHHRSSMRTPEAAATTAAPIAPAAPAQFLQLLLPSKMLPRLTPHVGVHTRRAPLRYFGHQRTFATTAATACPPTTAAQKKHVLVPVADGSEEIETVCIIDTLVRAGAAVTVASVTDPTVVPGATLQVTCSRGVKLVADAFIADCWDAHAWAAIVLPGGLVGAQNLRDSGPLLQAMQAQHAARRLLAAVCASPAVVLQHHGFLDGLPSGEATCNPSFKDTHAWSKLWSEFRVVKSGHLITSQAAGTSLEFALGIVAALEGPQKVRLYCSSISSTKVIILQALHAVSKWLVCCTHANIMYADVARPLCWVKKC
jgi:4-methyl-5(b-hydroxyethyl)-thiazole monophosphate biosynthesis